MKKLLKAFHLYSDMQYYEMIVSEYLNGNKAQAKDFFKALPKQNKIQFLTAAFTNWKSGLSNEKLVIFLELI